MKDKYLKFGKYQVSLASILVFLYFTRSSFINFSVAFGIDTSIVAYTFTFLFFTTLIVFTFISFPNNVSWDGIILIFGSLLFFIITMEAHPQYGYRFDDSLFDGRYSFYSVFKIGAAIYCYYIIRLFKDNYNKLYSSFRGVSFAIFFLNIWTIFNRDSLYVMDFGYQMSMAAILFMAQYLYSSKTNMYLILSLISIALGVVYGSRGCIIGYALFIVLFLIWEHRLTLKSLILSVFGVLIAVIYSSQTLSLMLYNFVSSLGINSRTLYYMAMGNILGADTARQDKIWPQLINVLENSSIFKINGAFGDRFYLARTWAYAHNIILEFLLTFGILIGTILIVLIACKFLAIFVKDKNISGLLTIIFGVFSISRLFISASFWFEPYFWSFIAMLVNLRSYKLFKKRKFKFK